MINGSTRLNIAMTGTPVADVSEATLIMNRLRNLKDEVLTPQNFKDPSSREIVKSLRQDISSLRRYQLYNNPDQLKILDRVRTSLTALQEHEKEKFKDLLTDNLKLNALPFNGVRDLKNLGSRDGIPGYCKHYPILDREALQGFYGDSKSGEGLECYEVGESRIGLDIKSIGQVLTTMGDDEFGEQSESLKKDITVVATAGVLRESAAYAGIFEKTDPDLSFLEGCAAGGDIIQGKRENPPQQKLLDLVNGHKANLPNKIKGLESQFEQSGLNRKEVFVKEHIKQALIIGNLYKIKTNGERDNDLANDDNARDSRKRCRDQIQEKQKVIFVDRASDISQVYSESCPSLVELGLFTSFLGCQSSILQTSQNPQIASLYEQCLEQQSGASNYDVGAILPVMAAKLGQYPLLFNREDNSNFLPFSESKSDFVPSSFAKKISNYPGADDISQAIKELILTNPVNPDQAIEELLSQSPHQEKLEKLIEQTQNEKDVQDSLQNEVKDYRRQITRSAQKICENKGDSLHHFPDLVSEVLARRLNKPGLSAQERQSLLAQGQAAQCHLLQKSPPEEVGGLPVALQVAGVAGAVAIGLIPGVGAAAIGLAIASGVGIYDGLERNDLAAKQLVAAEAALAGGYTTDQKVLDAAGRLTDSRLNLSTEALLAGAEGLGLLTCAVKAVNRAPSTLPPKSSSLTDSAIVNRQITTSLTEAEIRSANFNPSEYLSRAKLRPDEESLFIARLQQENPQVYKSYLDNLFTSRTDNVVVFGDIHLHGRADPNGERFEAFLNNLKENRERFSDPNAKIIMMGDVLDLPGYVKKLPDLYPEIAQNPEKYYTTTSRFNKDTGKWSSPSTGPDWDAIKANNPELWVKIRDGMIDEQMKALDRVAEAAGVDPKQIQTVYGNHEMPTNRNNWERNPDGSIPKIELRDKKGDIVLGDDGKPIMVSQTRELSKKERTKIKADERRDRYELVNKWEERYTRVTLNEEDKGFVTTKTRMPDGSFVERRILVTHKRAAGGENIDRLNTVTGDSPKVNSRVRHIEDVDGILVADSHAAANVSGINHAPNTTKERFFYASQPALGGGMHESQTPGWTVLFPERNQTFNMDLLSAPGGGYKSDWSTNVLSALTPPKPNSAQ